MGFPISTEVYMNISTIPNSRKSTLVHKHSFSTDPSKSAEQKDNEGQSLYTTFTYGYGCVFSNSGEYLATFSDGKDLAVLRTADWKTIGKR